ncbi:DNA polymerase III subunit gamma/tau [Cryobacterium sp. Y62]|uniref:DNA polymerase III subunit gamma/tau n=1 Tax=Cryobacterium sp. Y62 TaxID=2048284 RepID=UPI000CE3BB6F|nr:DNA polymerase III subunit gamma/tau [Cryobacterium sp. Y62]
MNATRDDDALNWAGDDDPTLAPGGTGQAAPEAASLPEGWTTPIADATPSASASASDSDSGTDSDTDIDTAADADATDAASTEPAGAVASSAALVGLGILAGMYLLYSIGWFIGVSRLARSTVLTSSDPVADFMTSLGGWLAVAAPVIWFGATFWLTLSRPRARWVWLLIGAVVLIPVPFLLGSGVPS